MISALCLAFGLSACDFGGNNAPASEGLEFTLSSDGKYYTVSEIGTCTDTDVVIPSKYENLPVKKIGYGAFSGCSSLTDITFKGTMKEWEAIEKGSGWNPDTGNYTVHCADGDVAKS